MCGGMRASIACVLPSYTPAPRNTQNKTQRTALPSPAELCGTDKYKNVEGSALCQDCPVGSFGPVTGGTDSQCQACGTSENATTVGSVACVCIPGFTRNGVVCQACPSGTAKSGHGDAECTQCNANGAVNYVVNTNRTQCECSQGHTGADCVQCAAGTYKESTGADACSNCLAHRSIRGSIGAAACQCDLGFGGSDVWCVCPERTNRRQVPDYAHRAHPTPCPLRRAPARSRACALQRKDGRSA